MARAATARRSANGSAPAPAAGEPTAPVRVPHVRVAVVGTGFSGLGMAIRLRLAGVDDFVVLERADEVGGTWRDNTYPGCACDVQAHLYSFSFAPNPHWRSTFGSQAELLEYLRGCADRFGVRSRIRFGHEVLAAAWDDDRQVWRIDTSQGSWTADVLVSGMGYLSEATVPDLPGLDTFTGTTFHSFRWKHGHPLAGERVAVIGTGASAIQFVPRIQPEVDHLDVYQRSAPWVAPKHDKPNTGLQGWILRHIPVYQRARRNTNLWGREALAFAMSKPKIMEKLQAKLAEAHLRDSVTDPELRARLTPDYVMGCKRLLFSNEWYPAVSAPNVDVVTAPIREIRARSIVTGDGVEHPTDTIIFGTGFRATNRPVAERVRGRGGVLLGDVWQAGMSAYRGTTIAGFPNLFMLLGPNTGLGHSSMTLMIEAQIAYVLDALEQMENRNLASVEVMPDAQEAFNDDIQTRLTGSVWNAGGCRSWYLDERGRNTIIWPTYTWTFRRQTRRFDLGSYRLRTRVVTGRPTRRLVPA